MKRVLIYVGLLGCVGFSLLAERGHAQAMEGGCPSIADTMCDRVDLSEVCGPGCYVEIMGKFTDG